MHVVKGGYNKITKAIKDKNEHKRRTLIQCFQDYYNARMNGEETVFVQGVFSDLQFFMKNGTDEDKAIMIPQIILLNILGYDTSFADFMILDVMSSEDYSLKRICYTAAGFIWSPTSEVVMMATNRIHKDLTNLDSIISSSVMNGLASYLSPSISQYIANDIIGLMSSSKPQTRQRAACTFYTICIHYPDALPAGISVLSNLLKDPDASVQFTCLSVIFEFCKLNPSNFLKLIPALHALAENSKSNWCMLKLISIFRLLCSVEPRLPKKLVGIFSNILENSSSITVLFECIKTIVSVPIANTTLLTYAAQRLQSFLEHQDPNLSFLCLTLFIKLMEVQPRLVAQNKELITKCLESDDEQTRLLALDLLMVLANEKTIDSIVAKMYQHFHDSHNSRFKDVLLTRVIEICSKNDYALISDFDWYINVLGDFIEVGGFESHKLVANQFMDLATRVPSTRPPLIDLMCRIIQMKEYRYATEILLACLYIISEYSEDSSKLTTIVHPSIIFCDERVQVSALSTAYKLYVRCNSEEAFATAESYLEQQLPLFQSGIYPEVSDIAVMVSNLIGFMKGIRDSQTFIALKDRLTKEFDEDSLPELEVPDELGLENDLLADSDNEDDLTKISNEEANEKIEELITNAAQEAVVKKKVHKRVQKKEERGNVVIKASKKPLFGNENSKPSREDPLKEVFANIDLASSLSQQSASGYQSKRQSYILPSAKDMKVSIKPRRLRGAIEAQEASKEEAEANKNNIGVSGPLEGARLQHIVDDDSMSVDAVEFYCDKQNPTQLSVDIEVRNKTGSEFSGVDFEIVSDAVEIVTSTPVGNVAAGESGKTKIVINVKVPSKPTKATIRVIPNSPSANTAESIIKIFPSFFLLPCDANEVHVASACDSCNSYSLTLTAKPRELLQRLVNLLRGPVIPQNVKTSKFIPAKNTQGSFVSARLSFEENVATVEFFSDNPELAAIIKKEAEMKTASLAKTK